MTRAQSLALAHDDHVERRPERGRHFVGDRRAAPRRGDDHGMLVAQVRELSAGVTPVGEPRPCDRLAHRPSASASSSEYTELCPTSALIALIGTTLMPHLQPACFLTFRR